MTLRCEVDDAALKAAGGGGALAAALAESAREVTKLRAEVVLVAPGSLPNDGKVIEDARKYD
jgi:phenylacetate-CoA ligase